MLPSDGVANDDGDDEDVIAEAWYDVVDRASKRCCGLQNEHKGFTLINNPSRKPPAKQGQSKWQCAGGNRE